MLYEDYAPTPFDVKGIVLYDRWNWIVAPTGHNRDSRILEESNFDAALQMLGGESEAVEVHRFNHWACGWLEIIIVDPESPQAGIVDRMARSLEDYPLLDEDDYSQRQWEAAHDYWRSMHSRERRNYLRRADMDPRLAGRVLFPSRHDDTGRLFELLTADA